MSAHSSDSNLRPDPDLELSLFREHGAEVTVAQCRSEADVIAAAQDCDALLVQYAPITDRVLGELHVRVI